MRPLVLVLLVLVSALAACGGEDGVEGASVPTEAVVRWFGAVESGDADEAAATTDGETLAVLLAVENAAEPGVFAEYVTAGVPADVAAAYWASFDEGFSTFAGRPLSSLRVGDATEFESQGTRYAAVAVYGRQDTESTVYVRELEDGRWVVDLVATLGSGFVGLFERIYDALPGTEEGDIVRGAFRDVVAPSLWATLALGAEDPEYSRAALLLLEKLGA